MVDILYTSYFGRIKDLPKHIKPVSVSLYTPRGINIPQYAKLAPTREILYNWKNKSREVYTEKDYERDYNNYVLSVLDPYSAYIEIMILGNGISVALDCYENDGFCHRHLISKWFRSFNIECIEYIYN